MNSTNNTDDSKSSLDVSLISEVTGDNLKDLMIEGAEIAFDHFLEEGVLKQVPVFGAIYRGGKAVLGLRESIFAKKVFKFLIELKDIPQEKRQQFVDKLNQDDEYRHKVGEKLVVLLDQLDDLEKPEIIGRLFKAAVNEKITYEEFLRLSAIVQKAFLPDLKRLKLGRVSNTVEEQFVTIGIYSLSLEDNVKERRYTSWDNVDAQMKIQPVIKFSLNVIGKKLIEHGLK